MTPEQMLAIEKEKGNILVSASAGSGKTTVLISRVINKVLKQKIDVDKLAILTFTNAAASELKERLLSAIYDEIKKDPKNTFLKKQIINLNRANISTIHSFCLNILRKNFSLIGLDPLFKIAEDSKLNILKNEAINFVIEDRYVKYNESIEKSEKNENELIYDLIQIFGSKEEEFVLAILRIYTYIQSFPYPLEWLYEQVEKYNLINVSEDTDISKYNFSFQIMKEIKESNYILSAKLNEFKLKFIEEHKTSDVTKYIELLDEDISKIQAVISNSNEWDKIYLNLQDIKFSNFPRQKMENEDLRNSLMAFRNKYMKDSIKAQVKMVYANSHDILKETNHMYKYLKYIYELIKDFDEKFVELKKEEGLIDFSDIEHLTLNLLYEKKENEYILSEIGKSIGQNFSEVYVDEYQDTSFVQEAIVEAVSGKKNRFMVGDIKQSIYRFRQAMPQIFSKKYEEYKSIKSIDETSDDDYSEEKIILSKNFRSRKKVVDSINYIFEKIMSTEMGECSYKDEEKLQHGASYYIDEENTRYVTEINIIDKKKEEEINENSYEVTKSQDDDIEESVKIEAVEELKDFEKESIAIASKVKELLEDSNFLVYDKNTNGLRKLKNKDIVILLRSIKNKGGILEEKLKNLDIPVFCDASTNIFDSDEINLLTSLLKIIDNPLDDISMVSIMFSIIGRFSLDELSYISKFKEKYLYDSLIKIDNINILELLNYIDDTKEKNKEQTEEQAKKQTNKEEKELLINIKQKTKVFLKLLNKLKEYSRIYKLSMLLSKIYEETNIYYQLYLSKTYKQNLANLDYVIKLAVNFENENALKNTSIHSFIDYIESVKNKGTSSDTSSAKIIGENEDVVRIMTIHKSKGLEFPVVILASTTSAYNLRDTKSSLVCHHELGIGINIYNDELKSMYPSLQKISINNAVINESKSEELRMLYVALTRAKEKLVIFGVVNDILKEQEKMSILYKEDNTIDSISVKQNNTYFKNILMAISNRLNLEYGKKTYNIDDTIFVNILDDPANIKKDINALDVNQDTKYMLSDLYKNKVYIENKSLDEKINEFAIMLKNSKENQDTKNKTIDILKNNTSFEYSNITDTYTDLRISVSELKKQNIEQNKENVNEQTNKQLNEQSKVTNLNKSLEETRLPNVLVSDDNTKLSSAFLGTLTHYILEHMDIYSVKTKEQIEKYIKLKLGGLNLKEEDINKIDIDAIYEFLNSNIVEKIRTYPKENLKREAQFILKDKNISKSEIQGIIDMYYIKEDGTIALIDFKTDKLKEEKQFIDKYKTQLDIYKIALQKLTNKKVSEVYIYSFNLKKFISL